MKPLKFFPLIATMVLACTAVQSDDPDITGVYVRQFKSEFGAGWDTVSVDADPKGTNSFLIRHKIMTVRKGEHQVAFPEHKELVLPATWISQNKVLVSDRLGRRYTFPVEGVLLLGTARYNSVE